MMKRIVTVLTFAGLLVALPALAQQTGSLSGTVTSSNGESLPGVTVEAESNVLPRPRVVTTRTDGDYTLPQLPPGTYTVTFSLSGMGTSQRQITILLDQQSVLHVTLGLEEVEEEIFVVAETPLVDPSSTAIRNVLGETELDQLPVAQEYRDLQKLIPGVQYSELDIRGPSAGGSGQDNVYLFDGVSVNLPLFGVLSTEPSNHDVDQVSIVKGGAKAVDFNRSAGFTIDTVSKSGTNQFSGEASYQIQTADMTGDRDVESEEAFEEDEDWATVSLGGPIVRDQLHFYGSYYRPTRQRDNRANVYGEVADFESERDELFGKLTWTPTASLIFHGSYRDSSREDRGVSVGEFSAASTSRGEDAKLEIGIAEGTWLINDRNFATLKLTDFENDGLSRPDNILDIPIAFDGSIHLDVEHLDRQGHFFVPTPMDGEAAFNAFIDPLVQQYGYLQNGVRVGGGDVGFEDEFDDGDYFRQSYQLGYDYHLGTSVTHELHVGYQWFSDEEDLTRSSNGWGTITVPGGRIPTADGQPIFFQARLFAGAAGVIPISSIRTEYESQNIELNDEIHLQDWTFNVGVLLSQDTLFGQGLREDSSTESGFVVAPGNKYEMHEIDWDELIQPRLGATWAYDEEGTLYASYARYNPSASSLPRAASWDRNFFLRTVDAFFDSSGDLIGTSQVSGSSGKLFQDDLDPRYVDEYLLGTSRTFSNLWSTRAYARYRYSTNFWEDTNNDARVHAGFNAPDDIPHELYVPPNDLIGDSSYVIAELDGAFSKYYEATVEAERRSDNSFLRASYTWSHYYGNFDQDNTNGDGVIDNDFSTFIGSSNFADGVGRQYWDMKYGNLRGDRRHVLKLLGSYSLPWDGSVGAFAVYQDGQPWETWDVEFYRDRLTASGSTSTSETIRFSESAGSRRSEDHYQLDLNYTQNIGFGDRYNVQVAADVFNVTDNQTGFAIQPIVRSPNYGKPTRYYKPRRFQLAVRFQF